MAIVYVLYMYNIYIVYNMVNSKLKHKYITQEKQDWKIRRLNEAEKLQEIYFFSLTKKVLRHSLFTVAKIIKETQI